MRKLIASPSGWLLTESPDPVARAGEAVVRVTRALIDPQWATGARASGVSPGREFVGTVVSTGPGGLEGRRVMASASIACSECDLCRAGLSVHCRNRSELGVARDGAMAERVALPATALHEIPKGLDDDRACFASALGRALHAADFVRLEGKPYVTIVGDDAVALLSAQVMTQRNASVRVLGREETRFGLCEKWGVKHRHIDQVGRRADQDVVFVCSDAPGDLEIALRLARPRATVLLVAPQSRSLEKDHSAIQVLHASEIALIGSRGERLAEALRLLATDGVDVRSLLTARYRFSQYADAFARAARPDTLRVLLEAA
ncbi:MAG: alcohol dehydrogenase catalytic domain-containing protein [Planctomycetes bacterium]|nr:alcohol dehydrogenase catalytic domain-containing protein [Planctomycetota bacterium]